MNNDVTEQETADLIDQNFELYFKENISPEIVAFKAEQDREKSEKARKVSITIASGFGAAFLLKIIGLEDYIVIAPVVSGIFALVLGLHKGKRKDYSAEFSRFVYNKAFVPSFRFYFPEIEFHSSRSLSSKLLNSVLLPGLAGVSSSGFCKFMAGNQSVQCFQYSRIGGLSGSLFVLKAPRNFTHKAVVINKTYSMKIQQLLNHSFFSAENEVKLESPNFDACFRVYSENQVAVRCLLTTSYMERLYKFSEEFRQ